MAATGFTPIILFNSTTASNAPTTSNLAVGELALNVPDGKLYFNQSGTIKVLASNAAITNVSSITFGTTGLTPSTATTGAVTVAGTLATTNGGTNLTTFTAANNAIYSTSATALTAGTLPIAAGGTGTTSTTFVNLASNVTGTLPIANGGTSATTLAGANIALTNTAQTFTATQTFNGTSATEALKPLNIAEPASVTAVAPAATTNFYINSGAVQYITANNANNWTLNFAFSSGTSLNTAMATNDSISCTLIVTNSTTAYYASAFTIDGVSVTPKWQGGSAPTSGDVSALDSYTFVIIKTASATYTVLASVTKFA